MALRLAPAVRMGAAIAVVSAVVASCAYKPGVTIHYVDPDGRTLKVWTGWPEALPPGSVQVGTSPDGLPVYKAPNGKKYVCIPTYFGMRCAEFEITGEVPGGGGFPQVVIEPARPDDEGGSTGVPPIDENGEEPPSGNTVGGGLLDEENDMATFTLPTASLFHWPDTSPFDVTVSQSGSDTTVSGSTSQVASYLAEAGVRRMVVPSDGVVPELFLEFRVGTLTPIIAANNSVVGFIDFDVLYTRYSSNMALVPEQYHPIRPLGRVR
ncbi:MAG: hypothetical protein KF691_02385 [Phycisphaeraceae bacterium]|nr:hypothetical protein [Phycisphaeraceae bacterium]